jgi:hypothetical protein
MTPPEAEVVVTDAEYDALNEVARTAVPLSRLPWPISSDERSDWREYQYKLAEALVGLAESRGEA